MEQEQCLRDFMTEDVISVSPNDSIQEAASCMSQYNIGSLPVVENGKLVGMITDRDITLRSTAEGKEATMMVSECMSTGDLTEGTPDMDPHDAAKLMSEHQIRRLPVVENGKIIGMVSIGDIATEHIYEDESGQALSDISRPSEPNS